MGEKAQAVSHVLLVSFPGQGHINPLLRLAKRIASKGVLVTLSSTLYIGHKIYASTKFSPGELIPVGKGHLRFLFFSNGWDVDDPCQYTDVDALIVQLRTAGSSAVTDLIRLQADEGHPVSCVIGNPFMPWVLDVAAELSIPSAVLWIQPCAVFSTYYHYVHALTEFPTADNPDVSVSLPGLPTLKSDEIPTFLLPTCPYKSLTEEILMQFQNISKATWVFANSFEELEREAIKAISALSPVIPVGPLVEAADELDSEIRGDLWKVADCREWLDAQQPHSVVYVSVGSVVILSHDEMVEMAYGLKSSGRPFLWVVREESQSHLPEGFVEEIKGIGMVVAWSPQQRVLAHGAVACFVTHCGWNSTLELLTAGVPVVAYPQWGDQVPDAKFLVDVYGVGVRLKAPVKREGFERCIEELTKGEKAEAMRARVLEWKEAARAAVAKGRSSDRNIQAFVDEVGRRVCGGGDSDQIGRRL